MNTDWGVQLARLTLFSSEPLTVSDKDWKAITGQDESETRQTILGGRSLSGKIPNGTLHLSSSGVRADIVNTAVEINETTEGLLPTLGPLDDVLAAFFDQTNNWVAETRNPMIRMAFGVVLIAPTPNRDEAYKRLKKLLSSVKGDSKRMQDFQYRVN